MKKGYVALEIHTNLKVTICGKTLPIKIDDNVIGIAFAYKKYEDALKACKNNADNVIAVKLDKKYFVSRLDKPSKP